MSAAPLSLRLPGVGRVRIDAVSLPDMESTAVGLNRGGDPDDPKEDGELKAVASLIRNRVPVDPARLANEDVDLRGLAVPGTH